ncbi:MAG: PA14 domain-containing protein [Roseibacillus sp.]
MLFLSPWLLLGLVGVGIPIIIHLVRQQAAKPIDWGAMRFLFDTVAVRQRRIEWEDWLLMATRCLLLALAALAVAMPFLPPDSQVPWLFVLPMLLVGVALFGGSFVVVKARWRWLLRLVGIALLVGAVFLGWMENVFNLNRFQSSERRDVALVIDASTSMALRQGGASSFERAVEEAREVVRKAPKGTSFTVVLGGPAPEAVTAEPLTHRADVLGVLDELREVGGSFRAHEALGMATLALAEGRSGSKEIIVWTDEQRHGWRLENPNAWDGLAEAWETLPAPPKLIVRNLGKPEIFRNVAVEGLAFSREVVGTDRAVGISLSVTNRGAEAMTPGRVTLRVEDKVVGERPVGLLLAGQTAQIDFQYRFEEAGPVAVEARLESDDDLLEDNRLAKVLVVRKGLRVLIVDGNPSAGFFERASGYLALALAPGKDRNLMDPEVVPVTQLKNEDFQDHDVVVLADVSRLPVDLATGLGHLVSGGAGLMVIAGPRTEQEFFNGWQGGEGLVMPALLEGERVDAEGVMPAAVTFSHESLRIFREEGDLSQAVLNRWFGVSEEKSDGVVGATLGNGDPWLVSHGYGQGRVLLVTTALDARSGNLPAKASFVPLVHEMVMWLSGRGAQLNMEASWSPRYRLGRPQAGLQGEYMKGKKKELVFSRVDAVIDFNWKNERPGQAMPSDRFSVRWQGKLVAPVTGEYRFAAEVDDEASVRIGEGFRGRAEIGQRSLGSCELVAGQAVDFELNFEEEGGDAYVRFYWTPPGEKEQLVPASAFRLGGGRSEKLSVSDPRGLPRTGVVKFGAGGQELTIEGASVPGLYEVNVGALGEQWFPGWQGETLPVAVTADAEESAFAPFVEEDYELMRKHTDVVLPMSVGDALAVLEGKGFGRGIWRWVAVAAFVFFLLESALARWVSKSRRSAESVRVDFGESPAWKEGGR